MSPGPPRDLVGYGRVRPRPNWPGGALVAINLVLVYEEGSEQRLAAGDPENDGWGEYADAAVTTDRDLGTETHYEYGSRAGVWRIAHIGDRLGLPVTVSATAAALELNPAVASWMREAGHDLLGHGWRWLPQQHMTRETEAEHLDQALESFERLGLGRPPGWNSRSFPSVHTRELLAERGFLYDSDPCNDDVPYFVETGGRRLLVVPYSKTLNDSRYLVSPGFGSPRDFVDHCVGSLEQLLWEGSERGGAMMTICVHARWSGQPARAAAFRSVLEHALGQGDRVCFMRRADIARLWIDQFG